MLLDKGDTGRLSRYATAVASMIAVVMTCWLMSPQARHSRKLLAPAPDAHMPSILCIITTAASVAHRSATVAKTWGQHIERLHVFGQDGVPEDISFGDALTVSFDLSEEYKFMFNKTREAWRYAYQMLQNGTSYDWYIQVDDETYLWVDNLLRHVATLNASDAIYTGYIMQANAGDDIVRFVQGGGGILISRPVVELLGPHLDECIPHYWGDVGLGRCLSDNVSIPMTSAKDEQGRSLLFPWSVTGTIAERNASKSISHRPVAFHRYANASDMIEMHEFITRYQAASRIPQLWSSPTKRRLLAMGVPGVAEPQRRDVSMSEILHKWPPNVTRTFVDSEYGQQFLDLLQRPTYPTPAPTIPAPATVAS